MMTFLSRIPMVKKLLDKRDDLPRLDSDSQPLASFLLELGLCISAALPILVYAYLGTFARHLADDYCDTARLMEADNFWRASLLRYIEWSGGYSNLLFIQVGEWFGEAGMVYMAAATLVLWLIGLTWLAVEIGEASGLRWRGGLSFGLAALGIFFSLYRTPNLYQVLFWRSSLAGYLAALVPLAYLAAFLLHQSRFPLSRARLVWSSLFILVVVLITGGTSETINTLQIGLFLLALLGLYLWRKDVRKEVFLLVGIGILGACLSLVIMALSPGNLVRLRTSSLPVPNLFSLGIETLNYVFLFIVDTFRVSPVPALLSFSMPFLLFYGLRNPLLVLSPQSAKKLKWLMGLLPLAMLIAIAFSFAPTAYARSFPSMYARFPALFLLTLTLMAEGGLSGYLLSQSKSLSFSTLSRVLVFGFLILTFLYPVRAAVQLYNRVPKYHAHAAAWDARDQLIRQAVAQGTLDLVVAQLDTVDGVQEYKGNESFWVNRCAADYYGLHSLRAP